MVKMKEQPGTANRINTVGDSQAVELPTLLVEVKKALKYIYIYSTYTN